ncbi:unnamed protein product [Ostreobium quekettii]|uniref:NLE domain-containing protein n=1 Tax=Ostreobium quekettii TaxID=121088 RepID=A0A8S1J694_9CHLO|nr:unnamed protein product [Ostreobium quekettii]|eukprot:evm.model.scf_85EXC.16 EVM.evm.TU.scf_85EXC.16   scf_85EXC:121567-128218(+)
MADRPAKARKVAASSSSPSANVIVQFESEDGVAAGPQLDVPAEVTTPQLETLLNGILSNEHKVPYSFQVGGLELAAPLGDHLRQHAASVEAALKIVYRPQAVFRVRPISRCTASLAGHSEAVLSVSFSPDGKHLASGSGDCTVRFWDLDTQTPLKTGQGHTNWVLAVAWSPDARLLATGDMDGKVWLWTADTGEPLGLCKGHQKWISSIAWEPAHLAYPSQRFCTGSKDCTIRVFDARTRRCQLTLSNQSKAITCVTWGGDGAIYSSSRDTTISVWDSKDGHLLSCLRGHAHWANTLAISSEYALRTGPFDHTGSAPEDAEGARKAAEERYKEATSSRPERLVSGSDDHTMMLWQPSSSNKPIARLTGHHQLINQVRFSPDGRWIISASFDKSVKLWDGMNGNFVASFYGHVGPVFQVSWSSDSRLFVSGSKDSTLKVWDMKSRKLKVELPGHSDEVFSVDWSPDGGSVASGGKDKVLKLWRH